MADHVDRGLLGAQRPAPVAPLRLQDGEGVGQRDANLAEPSRACIHAPDGRPSAPPLTAPRTTARWLGLRHRSRPPAPGREETCRGPCSPAARRPTRAPLDRRAPLPAAPACRGSGAAVPSAYGRI